MNRAALGALLSHWRRQPLQLITLIAGLALATGLWSAVQAINAEARASYDRAAQQLGTAALPALVSPSDTIPLDTYVALRRHGWQLAPVVEGRARLGEAWVTVMGIDILSYPPLPALDTVGARAVPLSDWIAGDILLARPETAEAITGAQGQPATTETDQLPPGVVLTDIGRAEALLNRPGQLSRLLVLPEQTPGLEPAETLAPQLVRAAPETGADTARLTGSFHLNLTAFALLSFAVGLFIVHGTIGLAFEQRRPLFRNLRALGLPLRRLVALVVLELGALALLAGVLGLGLGYGVAAALIPDVAATLRGLYGAPATGELTLRPLWVASGLGMAFLGTGLAASQALIRLARLPILSGGGSRAWASAAGQSARAQAMAGLVLIAAGLAAHALADGVLAGFALLAGLMLGAALLLPVALSALLALLGRWTRSPVARWVVADMRAQLPGLSLAFMALFLALATNIGVGTMVSSFRLTFTGWLDQRLASELYVTARSDAEGRAIETWLQDKADAVLPIRIIDRETPQGGPLRIYGVADHATYRDHWPLLASAPQVWDRVAQGQGVLVNEQYARSARLRLGAQADLGPGWQLPVVGVYSDYGNPAAQAMVSLPALLAQAPDAPNRRFRLRIDPDRAPDLAQAIAQRFELPSSAILFQSEIKAQSLAIFERTFVITAALNVLTLGVGAFAILTSLLTLWSMRLPQVAPVWAQGMTRAHLARLELARSVGLAALTAGLALPLGLLLAWVLLNIVNVEAFGWRLPMFLFPSDWLRLLLWALLAAFLAALIPARRLRALPPSDLLKVFASER